MYSHGEAREFGAPRTLSPTPAAMADVRTERIRTLEGERTLLMARVREIECELARLRTVAATARMADSPFLEVE